MKLKLRNLDDLEERELRELAAVKDSARQQKKSWQAGAYELQLEFSRISFQGQPVFYLHARGPEERALNRALAGLEFFGGRIWYHPTSETVALERHTGESGAPVISLVHLEGMRVRDLASEQRLVWRSLVNGSMVLSDGRGFCTLDNQGQRAPLLAGYAEGQMIEDMLIAYNPGQPRAEMSLADPLLLRCVDHLSPELMGAQLGVDFSRDLSIRLVHRSELELCFELVAWDAGRCTSLRKFAVGIGSIALGTIDE